MIRPSFVPPLQIRRLRDVTRYRIDLAGARGAEKNRVEKLLEDAGIKLSVVASDIFGVSGRAMMAALIAGERSPVVLAQLARTRMRTRIPALQEAFTGHFTSHHAFLLAKMLARIDGIDADIAELHARIEEMIVPFAAAAERLDEIPGIGRIAAAIIIAEIGTDMTRFPTAGHLASWAKFTPGVKESAGKKKGSGSTGHGNRYLAGSSARRSPERPGLTPSWASVTGGSPAAVAPRKPSSPPAGPSWSSSGTCRLTPTPATPTWAATSSIPGSIPNAASARTSTSSKPLATKSPSNPPPDQHLHPARLRCAPPGAAARPVTHPFSD